MDFYIFSTKLGPINRCKWIYIWYAHLQTGADFVGLTGMKYHNIPGVQGPFTVGNYNGLLSEVYNSIPAQMATWDPNCGDQKNHGWIYFLPGLPVGRKQYTVYPKIIGLGKVYSKLP